MPNTRPSIVAAPCGCWRAPPADRSIRIEVRQLDKTINIEWPLEGADQCKDWLRELLAK